MQMMNETIFQLVIFVGITLFQQGGITGLYVQTDGQSDGLLDFLDMKEFDDLQKLHEDYKNLDTKEYGQTETEEQDEGILGQIVGLTKNVQGYVASLQDKLWVFMKMQFGIQAAQVQIVMIPVKWQVGLFGVSQEAMDVFTRFITYIINMIILVYAQRWSLAFVRGV